jgi:putative DNA primase/helicase
VSEKIDNPPSRAPADGVAPAPAYAGEWADGLRLNEKTLRPLGSLHNVVLILSEHPEWQGVIAMDRFSGRILKRKPGPHGGDVGEWSDLDDIRTTLWLSSVYEFEPNEKIMIKAVEAVAENNGFHEVQEYLNGLKWDGVPRVSKSPGWLCAYLGAEETDYHFLAGMKFLISAVARIMIPGCKADHVLILEGMTGLGKSTSLQALFGKYFTDSPLRIGDREAAMMIRGVWGVELGELDSFNKAESTAAKQFFTQNDDRYRSPWGKRPATVKRQCVFSGSTNQTVYFKDETGNRRYWPIACTRADIAELKADRDQLWAEAVHLFRQGVPWHPSREENALFEEEQGKRMIRDAFEEKIREWLDDMDAGGARKRCTMSQILGGALGLDAGRWTRAEQTRVGQVMSRIPGWSHKLVRIVEGSRDRREWVYVRETD